MVSLRLAGQRLLTLSALLAASLGGSSAQSTLDPHVQKEMLEIYSFKESLTPAERKLSTNLVLETRHAQGKLAPNMVRYARALNHDVTGRFAVEVHGLKSGAFVDSALKAEAQMTDGSTPLSAGQTGRFHARVTEAQLLRLPSSPM